MTTVQGFIRNKIGDSIGNVNLTFINTNTKRTEFITSRAEDGGYSKELPSGNYVWVAMKEGYAGYSESVSVPDDPELG